MNKVNGFGYRFNNELHVSVNPVKGGWPLAVELDPRVELVPVTSYELRIDGEKITSGQAIARGLLRTEDQGVAEARVKITRAELAAVARAERAAESAQKALAKAEALRDKAEAAIAAAKARGVKIVAA